MRNLLLLLITTFYLSLTGSVNQTDILNQLMNVNQQWSKQPEVQAVIQTVDLPGNQSFNQWISIHLMLVEKTLRARDTKHLTPLQIQNRNNLLSELNGYWKAGVYPVNDYLPYKNPVFIDRNGTHCAVGYLMMQSGQDALAQTIDANEKFAYVYQIKTSGVKEWAENNGFTIDELAWIQPGYPPSFDAKDLDKGLNGPVNSIVIDNTSQIVYAAGNFSGSISGNLCNNIAAWVNGIAGYDWIPLTSGLNGVVHTLLLHNNKLYAGGTFTMAGNVAVNHVAMYDIGSGQWQTIGSLDSTVYSLKIYNNELYAGGKFTGFVSKWNDTAWVDISTGFLYGEGVRTLEVWNNELIIGGNFELATGALRKHVASYDGTYMGIVGMGTVTPVNDFEVHNGNLFAACDMVEGNDTCALAKFDNGNWVKVITTSTGMMDGLGGNSIRKIVSVGNALLCAGDFQCASGLTWGNNLMSFQQQVIDTVVYNVYTPMLTTDNALNEVVFTQNTIYFGGEFIVNAFSDTLNHIGYLDYNETTVPVLTKTSRELKISPNPAHEWLNISVEQGENIDHLEITDALGRQVWEDNPSHDSIDISVSSLAKGVYIIRSFSNRKMSVKRFVKD
ncbi:MAG: T9SS type A sorting domain-containing protein [Chitinophagales bacterium]